MYGLVYVVRKNNRRDGCRRAKMPRKGVEARGEPEGRTVNVVVEGYICSRFGAGGIGLLGEIDN